MRRRMSQCCQGSWSHYYYGHDGMQVVGLRPLGAAEVAEPRLYVLPNSVGCAAAAARQSLTCHFGGDDVLTKNWIVITEYCVYISITQFRQSMANIISI